ncbi:MAG: hypothetical protein AAF654_09635 [Myxococcota bacterium]
MRRSLLIAAAAAACAEPAVVEPSTPGPAELEAYVERSRVRPGEEVTYRLVLERNENVEVRMAPPGEDLGDLTVVERGQIDDEPYPGRLRTVFWYRVQAPRARVYELPTFRATYVQAGETVELATRTVFIEAANEPPSDENELKDIRVPGAPTPVLPWILASAAALAVLGLVLGWLKRNRNTSSAATTETPEQRVRRRLDGLTAIEASTQEGARRLCFELTEALKEYLETLCDINASDLTTQEIASSIQGTWLPTAIRDEFLQVLNAADRVKFAGEVTSVEALQRLVRMATHFVDHAHRDPSIEAAS